MVPLHVQMTNSTLRRVIKRLHFTLEILLGCLRWYASYPLSLRNLEERSPYFSCLLSWPCKTAATRMNASFSA